MWTFKGEVVKRSQRQVHNIMENVIKCDVKNSI